MTIVRSKWPLLCAGAVVLAFVLAFLGATPASAHAVLERSVPLQNQELAESPEIIETWYSEPLERSLTTLRVLDSQGNDMLVSDTMFSDSDPNYAAVAPAQPLPPGIYTVAYENVSQVDGHQWAGTFSFIVLNADGSVPSGTAFQLDVGGQAGFLPGIGDSTLHWLGLLAAVALCGATIFYLFVSRPAADFLTDDEQRRVQDAAMALAADIFVMAVPVMLFALFGQIFLLADRLGGIEQLDNILFDTRTGELWISRIGLSVALGLLFVPALMSQTYRVGSRTGVVVAVALVGTLGLLMTYSLGSHAAAASGGQFWAAASDFVHFVATGAWIGALLQLPLVFWWSRNRLDPSRRLLYMANVLDRFSWLAAVSVVLLIGTGVFNGFVQLPTLESFWETTYGRVLIVKMALILPMLGVAGINALFLKPALVDAIDQLHQDENGTQPPEEQRARFARRLERVQRALPWTTVAEFALGAAVLISVSVLAQSTTAGGELRQNAGEPSGEYVVAGRLDDVNAELLIKPFGLGVSAFTVALTPVPPAQDIGELTGVRLLATYDNPNAPPSAGRSGTLQELKPTDQPNVWSADAALLTQPGNWRVEIRVQRREKDDVRIVVNVPEVGGILARQDQPKDLFDLPFTFVNWNIVAGGAMIAMGLGAFLIWRNRPPSWSFGTANAVAVASLFGLIAGAVLIFGVDVHRPVDTTNASPIKPTSESLARGRQLFEANCIQCHGPTGGGDGPAAAGLPIDVPRYDDHVPYHNDYTLYNWITNGIERDGVLNMPAWGDVLTEDERWTLVTFLRQTWGSGNFRPVLPDDIQTPSSATMPAPSRTPTAAPARTPPP